MIKIMIKKILLFGFIFLNFLCISSVSAKSLSNYRSELQDLQKQKETNQSNQQQTQSQINATNIEIANITNNIVEARNQVSKTEVEIENLEEDIDKKKEEIKDLVVFLQVSDSENFYLNYVFGAKSFQDFIYRASITKQLTKKNESLIQEMNVLIDENEKKIVSLENKQKELADLNVSLQKKVSSLGSDLTKFTEDAADIDTQIKSMQQLIDYYVGQKCDENVDVSQCDTNVPFDSSFDRPLKSGVVTDEFGMRLHPTQGIWKLHSGIDLGGNAEGTSVYAPASGKVVAIYWRTSCGGTQLILNHIVDGKYYTTQYMHLLSVKVSVGDIVSKGQVIATVGGGGSTSWYDGCSTGAHLHFMIANGHYLGSGANSYHYYADYYNNLLDPRTIIWFPKYGIWW